MTQKVFQEVGYMTHPSCFSKVQIPIFESYIIRRVMMNIHILEDICHNAIGLCAQKVLVVHLNFMGGKFSAYGRPLKANSSKRMVLGGSA